MQAIWRSHSAQKNWLELGLLTYWRPCDSDCSGQKEKQGEPTVDRIKMTFI